MEEERNEYIQPSSRLKQKEEEVEARQLAEALLEEQLGDNAWLVVRYLGWPGPKRNTMTNIYLKTIYVRGSEYEVKMVKYTLSSHFFNPDLAVQHMRLQRCIFRPQGVL